MKDLNALVRGKRWQFSWDRRMTYQKMRLFSYAYHHELPKMFDVSLSSELYRVKDFLVSECYDAEEYAAAFAKIEERFADKNSIGLFETLMKLIRSFEEDFKPYVEAMPTSYSSYDNEQLALAYENFCEVEHKISLPNWVLFVPFEEIITRTLQRTLKEELGDAEKVEQIIKGVSLPHKMIPLDMLNRALYEIALAPENEREDLLVKLTERLTHWGTFDVIYPEASLESFRGKLAAIQNLDIPTLLAEIEKKYRTQTETTKTILESWKQNAYVYGLLNLYSHYANYKEWKNFYREQSSYKLKILLQEIGRRIGLPLEETSFLTGEETTGALRGSLSLDPVEISKRTKNSAYLFFDGMLYITTDPEILSVIDASIAVPEKTELRGTGAYLGKATGIARIIISSDDFGKLKAGDILVTSTTRPDYVPIMAIAAGFVTNEGGLLSHAAIVARELKKPCIIGTKIATQVLHDGDLVEVDANNGVVRIIK